MKTDLVDAKEREIAILAHLAILSAINHERSITCSCELFTVGVGHGLADGFASEPGLLSILA